MLVGICYLGYEQNFDLENECFNKTSVETNKKIFFFIDVCRRNEFFIATFLVTIILARWAYPIQVEKFKKSELSNLLILYAANGGEIAEFASYVNETKVIQNKMSFLLIMGNYFHAIVMSLNFY
jgi:hypothetical protein